MKKQKVWILETSRTPLTYVRDRIMTLNESKVIQDKTGIQVNTENKSYVFSGPCAFFGEQNTNENDRWYTKEDYLSHLPYLQEQIEQNCLLGSSDHAEEYLVSMKDVSHKINKLWYDEKLDQVWIEIELIPTINGNGLDLMAIVDKNVPLFISSRATGYMSEEEGGEVTLDYIYTYDVVYRPGFAKAQLKRITPSAKNYGKNVEIYECKLTDDDRPSSRTQINNQSQPIMEYVSKTDFDKFQSEVLGLLKNINEGKQNAGTTAAPASKPMTSLSIDSHIKKGKLQKLHESAKPKNVNESITDESKSKLEELAADGFKFYKKTVLDLDNIYDCYFVSKADTAACAADLGSPEGNCEGCFTIAMIYNKDLSTKKLAGEEVTPACGEVTAEEFEGALSSIRDDQQDMIFSLLEIAKTGGTATFDKSPRIFNSDAEQIEATQAVMESRYAGREEFTHILSMNEALKREVSSLRSALGVTIDKVNESISQLNAYGAFAETTQKHITRLEDQADNIALKQNHLGKVYETLKVQKKDLKTILESVNGLEKFSKDASLHVRRLEESVEEIADTTNQIVDRVDAISPENTFTLVTPEGVTPEQVQALVGDEGKVEGVNEGRKSPKTRKAKRVSESEEEKAIGPEVEFDQNTEELTLTTKMSQPEVEALVADQGITVEPVEAPAAAAEPIKEPTTDQILESVKKRKTKDAIKVYESQFPFLKKVSYQTQETFVAMSDIKKKRVCEGVADEDFVSDEIVKDVINTVEEDGLDQLYATMPEEMQAQWDSLSQDQRNAVIAAYRQKGGMTPEEVEQFWYSVEVPATTNESFGGRKKSEVDDVLGYNVNGYLK